MFVLRNTMTPARGGRPRDRTPLYVRNSTGIMFEFELYNGARYRVLPNRHNNTYENKCM